jgi:hypothetical protein
MYTHPDIGSKLDHDRHRDMRVHVGQHRLARHVRNLAGRPGPPREPITGSAAPGARYCGRVSAPTPDIDPASRRRRGLRRQRARLRP